MWKSTLKTVALTTVGLLVAQTSYAKDGPIEILLDEVNLDLSDAQTTAIKIRDKNFKSNDPLVKSRIFRLKNGTRVKLVGRSFSKIDNIDKIKITYPSDETAYYTSYNALKENFGAPSMKRPNIYVWRLNNTPKSSTQSDYIKIIAAANDKEKHTIIANRQRGGKGNNQRGKKLIAPLTPTAKSSNATLRSIERD